MNDHPTQIGTHRVVREIGRGGMGVVYLARDERLDRNVAIKALPAEVAADPQRLARFEREARALAQLNHPNVAGIFGVEEQDGQRFLVLEYVEGETLRERLEAGPLPLDEALPFALEIAAGVEAAHEAGVVHRDLKPDNIKITPEGTVKVLDFGLARTGEGSDDSSSADLTATPTRTTTPSRGPDMTMPGAVMGTAAYMSPEQARGRAVDRRTDIWSFGVILYEMLCGASPFVGETATDSLGAVLHKEIDLARLPAGTPWRVEQVLRRCLDRSRGRRYRHIGDAALDLQAPEPEAAGDAAGPSPRRGWALAAAALVAGVALGALGILLTREPAAPTAGPVRFEIDLEHEGKLGNFGTGPNFALSADGSFLVYVLELEEGEGLFLRELDESDARLVAEGPLIEHPFLSPDGQWIAYFTDDTLMKVAVTGGSPLVLAAGTSDLNRGGAWGPDDTIIFAPDTTSPLMRLTAGGGAPEPLTTLNPELQERSHRWPAFVPGRPDLLVFTSETHDEDFDESSIEILDLASGERHLLHDGGAYGRVTADGHLLFAREDTLFGAPLAGDYRSLARPPAPLISDLTHSSGNGGSQFALSDNGVMIYVEGPGGAAAVTMPTWIDLEDGTETPLLPEPARLFAPEMSPDGSRIAFQQEFFGGNVAVYEIRRGILAPVYPSEFRQIQPVWSADSTQIAFSGQSEEQFVPSLFVMDAGGEKPPVRLGTADAAEQYPTSWSPDGRTILFDEPGKGTSRDIFTYDVESGEIEVLVASPGEDRGARFSPDGAWVAYESDASGQYEVYVRRTDGRGNRLQVSTGGGGVPRWAADGSAIYYLAGRGDVLTLMNVAFDPAGVTAALATPEAKLQIEIPQWTGYAVDPNGGRILVPLPPEDDAPELRVHLVIGWEQELRRLLPAGGGAE